MKEIQAKVARVTLWSIVLLACSGAGPLLAGALAPTVVSGQASFQRQGSVYSITNTPGAIIEWPAFSVAAGETTRFIQQSAASTVLNRITGQEPSKILGTLQSNGRVFLINPNGVLFGADSRVDVKGLVASTLNISNADFLAGRMNFSAGATAGSVVNQGQIATPGGGRVILIAPDVENSGIIHAPGGAVVLAAGRSVQLADSDNPDLHVVVSAPKDQALNLGRIVAQSGRVGIYGNLVNQRGLVSADSAAIGPGGQIVFKASGELTLDAGSMTTADGGGDGGKVVARSDGITHMLGSISARGGANPGNGGFVEVSGPVLDMRGTVDTRAPNGHTGTLLLDPTNIYIANDLASAQGAGMVGTDASAENFTASGPVADSLLSVGTLQAALATSVVVVSTANPAGTGAGFIRVVDPVTWAGDTSLGLNATAGIAINGAITGGPGSRLDLQTTSGNISQSAPIKVSALTAHANTGAVTLTSAGNAVGQIAGFAGGSGGFNFTNGQTALTVSPLGQDAGITALGSGPINLTTGADLTLDSSITSQAGNVVVTAAGTVTANNAILTSTSGRVTLQGVVVRPSLADCTANPAQEACIGVLPSLATCQADPNVAGCSAVLPPADPPPPPPPPPPTLSECIAAPATDGCSQLLPTLSLCIASPSTLGCSVVLPTLSACTATPSAPGCSVVLPTLAQCTSTPTAPGCTAVLPTLASCTANPAAGGCAVVLPSLATCVANPSAAGCTVVLPTLAACVANPAAPGCTVVLPTLAACVANPSAPGCVAVLPTLAACAASPAIAGCSAVLPTLAQCTITPTAAGCGVVLPTLAACIAAPGAPGCSAVLPSLASCMAAPAAPGCAAVLPSLAACVAAPSTAGCGIVLPSLASCVSSPATAGCSAVLPSLASCTANPAQAGCSVVLPTLAQCIATPTSAGCFAVLPTLAQCVGSPALQGCAAVLPPISFCSTHPTDPTCQVVLPPSQTTQVNLPVSQAINTTVNIINTVNSTVTALFSPPSQLSGGTGSPSTPGISSPAAPQTDAKNDDKKDGKTDVASTDKSGTKNEPAKKMYCN